MPQKAEPLVVITKDVLSLDLCKKLVCGGIGANVTQNGKLTLYCCQTNLVKFDSVELMHFPYFIVLVLLMNVKYIRRSSELKLYAFLWKLCFISFVVLDAEYD